MSDATPHPRTPEVVAGMQEGLPEQSPENVIQLFPSQTEGVVDDQLPPYDPETAKFLSPGQDGDSLYNTFDRRKSKTGMPTIIPKPEGEVEQDPAGEVTRPDPNDVRKAISRTDGEVELAKHDFERMSDTVMKLAGLVKAKVTPSKVQRNRTHGEVPKRPQQPLVKDRVPSTGKSDDKFAQGIKKLSDSGVIPTTSAGYSARKPKN